MCSLPSRFCYEDSQDRGKSFLGLQPREGKWIVTRIMAIPSCRPTEPNMDFEKIAAAYSTYHRNSTALVKRFCRKPSHRRTAVDPWKKGPTGSSLAVSCSTSPNGPSLMIDRDQKVPGRDMTIDFLKQASPQTGDDLRNPHSRSKQSFRARGGEYGKRVLRAFTWYLRAHTAQLLK